jgi:hypothetical protein
MEDAKLQALHDTLSILRGGKGLGTAGQYSWQSKSGGPAESADARCKRHGLPTNPLYAYFLPEGAYDSNMAVEHGDGRFIKRDFTDLEGVKEKNVDNRDSSSTNSSCTDNRSQRQRQKEKRRREKKEVAKAAKLEVKRMAKMEEKKQLKILNALKRSKDSKEVPTPTILQDEDSFPKLKKKVKKKKKSKDDELDSVAGVPTEDPEPTTKMDKTSRKKK